MLPEKYILFLDEVSKKIDPKRIITDPLKTLAYGTDASFYRLIPKIVIQVHTEKEVKEILKITGKLIIPVTFRAAGTSLSGQAITDSVLVVASHKWKNYLILDNGNKIKLQPGIVGSRANIYLAPYGKKIGPDPASINAAMIGGIASNNASGMCCGTSQNSYQTIADIRMVLYDGTVLDTSDKVSKEYFSKTHPEIIEGIYKIKNTILKDSVLFERIKRKFKIKNTTGYSINAFVDYEDPIDIIKHLMIGSEGTLAFISDITYHTVTDYKYKACSLLLYDTIERACETVPALRNSPVSAVELLDRDCIRSVENDVDAPEYFKTLPESVGVLLVDIQADNIEELREKEANIRVSIESIPVMQPYEFTTDPKEYNFNWKARKGLLASVGGLRKKGTTCLIEDVAFPVPRLAEACSDLKNLFKKYEYHDAVLFGHALEGNLHLVFSQDFSDSKEIQRYADLMDELADIVVDKFDGSLKAEHGTGRNMAPFVEKEWGEAAYKLMVEIKNIFDPHQLINPGVIINPNPEIHLENLKPLPEAHDLVDKCMECGFCEPSCVSEGLTLSPRQRIVVEREIARLKKTGENVERLNHFVKESAYNVDETCATDGLCLLACPVGIDTGIYVKALRHNHITPFENKTANYITRHFSKTTHLLKNGLHITRLAQKILGNTTMYSFASGLRKISGNRIPQWNPSMPFPNKYNNMAPASQSDSLKVVYYPSCINRTMGISNKYQENEVPLTEKTVQILTRAGYTVIYPENMTSLCCGMPFSSKGFNDDSDKKSQELEKALLTASANGKYPILYDMSPCYYTSHSHFSNENLKIYDPIHFMLEFVMPKLEIKNPKDIATVFPICSVKKSGLMEDLVKLTQLCAQDVNLIQTNCCGFAGDRGFTHPELNKHGQRHLKEQIPAGCTEGYSTSRTCEIGMEEYSEINFKSIFYLIDEVTR